MYRKAIEYLDADRNPVEPAGEAGFLFAMEADLAKKTAGAGLEHAGRGVLR